MAVQCQVPCKETFGAVSPSPECWQSNRQTQLQEVNFYLIYWSSACDQARNDSSLFVSAYSVSRGVLTPATRPWRWSQRCLPIPALQRWDNGTGVSVCGSIYDWIDVFQPRSLLLTFIIKAAKLTSTHLSRLCCYFSLQDPHKEGKQQNFQIDFQQLQFQCPWRWHPPGEGHSAVSERRCLSYVCKPSCLSLPQVTVTEESQSQLNICRSPTGWSPAANVPGLRSWGIQVPPLTSHESLQFCSSALFLIFYASSLKLKLGSLFSKSRVEE